MRPLSTGGKWTERPPGGHYTKGEMPPGTPRSRSQKQPAFAPQPRVCRGASLPPPGTKGAKVRGSVSHETMPRKTGFAGAPENSIDFRQVNCRKSDGGTRRRGPLRGQTAQARRGKEPCSSRKPSSIWTGDGRREGERPLTTPCLPLTREVASPKGLTEGEIRRAYCKAGGRLEGAGCEFSPSVACGDSSLVRGSQEGWAMPADRPLRGSQALRGSMAPPQREPRGWDAPAGAPLFFCFM